MTNADLQKAFDAGYAAAKALYSILQKGGIEVTEADIRRIVEEVIGELAENGQIGGLEQTKNYIAPEQTVECTYNPELGGCFTGITLASIQSMPPEKLYFSVDGTVYECEKQTFNDDVLYGNLSLVGEFEDTGEPFAFLYDQAEIWEGLFKGDVSFSCTISAWTQTETTTPISDKYLPGVCLPVVELTSDIPNTGDVEFTEAEGTLLAAAVASKTPIIISCTFSGKPLAAVFNNSIDSDGTIVLFTKISASTLQILGFDDGVWVGELISI